MEEHVCPVWVGYVLASPIRKIFQNPRKILNGYVREGMTAMDIGPAMGFFSIPMAGMVGNSGKVICVDLQEKMLRKLDKRAAKEGVSGVVETRLCTKESFGIHDLKEKVDFALAFYVIHEAGDLHTKMREIHDSLRAGGLFLIAEPSGHVTPGMFAETLDAAKSRGFEVIGEPRISRSRTALLKK